MRPANCPGEDLIRPPELTILPFQALEPLTLVTGQAGAQAVVDLGPSDPVAQRLMRDADPVWTWLQPLTSQNLQEPRGDSGRPSARLGHGSGRWPSAACRSMTPRGSLPISGRSCLSGDHR